MGISVFGAVFLDRYIYEEHGSTEIIESIGGSGLNIALGLHLLGHDVEFYSNMGDDKRKNKVLNKLKPYNFPIENIHIREGLTGLFTTKNDKVLSVERGVNAEPLTVNMDSLGGECAVITTELNKTSIQRLLTHRWKRVFLDVGPRPHILKDICLPQNIIKIGNALENEISPCHIVKLGPKGAKWEDIVVKGNNASLPYTIGAGDLFDTILIDSFLKGMAKKEALKRALRLAEIGCMKKGGFKLVKIQDELGLNF